MKPEIKKLWVEALRSGEFSQATEILRENDSFCCLGVLCELHRRETRTRGWKPIDECADPQEYSYFNKTDVLPLAVANWAELEDLDPKINTGDEDIDTLAACNDNGYTFFHIANLIEEQL